MQLSDVDMRDALLDEIYNIAAKDRDVVFLTDDMDAFSLRRFKQDMPDQFINIGVAEQNMINVATGLANGGKRVFTYGIASFVSMRCFEQIKVNLCSMNLPVTIIGVGPGFSFEYDGPTHHGTQDIAIMRALPEITIYNPSDISLASACAHLAYESDGPVYLRLDKGTFPLLGRADDDFSPGFRVVKPLQDINIVGTGFMVAQALQAAELLEERSISVGVIDLYRLKPVGEAFFSQVLAQSKEVVTLEDNSIVSGLGTIVAELLADHRGDAKLSRLAVADKQFLSYGSREWFHAQNQIDVSSVVETVAALARH